MVQVMLWEGSEAGWGDPQGIWCSASRSGCRSSRHQAQSRRMRGAGWPALKRKLQNEAHGGEGSSTGLQAPPAPRAVPFARQGLPITPEHPAPQLGMTLASFAFEF